MAPNVAQFFGKKKATPRPPLIECAMNKVARGAAVFTDEHVEAMAAGKNVKLPKNLDDIVLDVDDDKSGKPVPKELIATDEEVRTYSDAIEKAMCPKYETKRNMFALFDDATWHSDGEEVKRFNVYCQGTESSPCSYCSEAYATPPKNPPKKTKDKNELVQAEGFNLAAYEGEESPPKKRSKNACKWCDLDPCIVDDNETMEEGRVIVDNLNAQKLQGVAIHLKEYRYALYKMHARALGFIGCRHILPNCVYNYINKHFSTKDEERTGYIGK